MPNGLLDSTSVTSCACCDGSSGALMRPSVLTWLSRSYGRTLWSPIQQSDIMRLLEVNPRPVGLGKTINVLSVMSADITLVCFLVFVLCISRHLCYQSLLEPLILSLVPLLEDKCCNVVEIRLSDWIWSDCSHNWLFLSNSKLGNKSPPAVVKVDKKFS